MDSAIRYQFINFTVSSFPCGKRNEFRLDAGNQPEVPVTVQKRHAVKNSVRCYQAIIRGTNEE